MPKGTLLFFVVHIYHCDAIFISQYIGTPVTDVITSSNLDKNVQCLAIWGPWGPFNDQTGHILFPSYPSTHIYVHVKTEAIWQKLFTFKSKIWTKYNSFHIGGGGGVLGGLTSNPRLPILLWKYDLMTVQIWIIRGKNNYQFSCKSLNVILFCIFGYSGGGGGAGYPFN